LIARHDYRQAFWFSATRIKRIMDNGIKITLIDDLALLDNWRDEWENSFALKAAAPFLCGHGSAVAQRMSEEGNSPILLSFG
jgi:hypothetical protein